MNKLVSTDNGVTFKPAKADLLDVATPTTPVVEEAAWLRAGLYVLGGFALAKLL